MSVPRSVYIAFLVSLLLGVCSSHRRLPEGEDHHGMSMEAGGEVCLEQGDNRNCTKPHDGNLSYPLADAMDSDHNGIRMDCKKCRVFKECKSCLNGNTSLIQPKDSYDNDDDPGCSDCPFAECKKCSITIESGELSVEARAPESG
ncbi:hypothetical protein Patl1_10759 [Pistacia atlantica]|uniref:Uncharacterized protein n=1 Tax=Pistacia atlantica TaxID=434234 RepID=A0ACC1A932_9ROSI|nr:hypothetical protein Patl1_10759 [Pistacia atlantica]